MESKTKYRILGILVIIAIVIIVMPFVHFKKEADRDIISPPPFPEQTAQVNSVIPEPTNNDSFEDTQEVASSGNASALNPLPSVVTNEGPQEPAATSQPTSVTTAANNNETAETVHHTLSTTMQANEHEKVAQVARKPSKQHLVKTTTKKVISSNNHPQNIKLNSVKEGSFSIRDNGLYDIKHPVWVIQLGSFQSKLSAERMVNSLRANGYKAFFQEIDTVLGAKTRVFVGPELDQVAARHLAKQLEAELKVRGVVASYKPFAL